MVLIHRPVICANEVSRRYQLLPTLVVRGDSTSERI